MHDGNGKAGRQEDDGDDDGDLQGRKVIKSFFLFLFLPPRPSVVRSFAASSKFPISTKMRERR